MVSLLCQLTESQEALIVGESLFWVHLWGVFGVRVITFKLTGLPWWSRGKESALSCRRHWFDPRSGRIPLGTGHLSPCNTGIEPVP